MIRLIGAALAVALTLTLLAACGGQSTPEKGETAEFYSETHDEDGFDTVPSVKPAKNVPVGPADEHRLIPYGCAKLRMTEMPRLRMK